MMLERGFLVVPSLLLPPCFRSETNLQSNLLSIVKLRNAYPHQKEDGVVKMWKTKAEMSLFKPSDLLVREEDQDLSRNSSDGVRELSPVSDDLVDTGWFF